MSFDRGTAERVRGLFEHADYTVAGVRHLLGPVVGAALARDEVVPALRATRGGSPLEALIRLFWLQVPVPAAALPYEDLAALGLVERSGDEIRALLHVEPVEPPPAVAAEPYPGPPGPATAAGAVPSAGPAAGPAPAGDATAGPPGSRMGSAPGPWGGTETGPQAGSRGGPGAAPGGFAGAAPAARAAGGPAAAGGSWADDGFSVLGYVVSDLKARPGGPPPRPDHVVGQGGASANLAQLVIRRPVDSALDLGTGSGVQALHLAARARHITATDVSPRALEVARLSLALSGVEAELLEGSLFEPVACRTFDLIVSNPPFVISPEPRFEYRESGLPGDELCRRLVRQAPARLAPDGWCHLLANWLHVEGEDWRERVAGWIEGVDGWVVQRDVRDPAEYAEMWLRDSCETGSPEYRRRYDAWLEAFEARKVTGIGFGWITLHNSGGDHVRVEELRHAVDQPVGAYVRDVVRGRPAPPTPQTTLRAAPGLVQAQIGPPGAEDPERIVLRQTRGLRRAAQVGTVAAALAGACDGDLPLGPLLAAIAEIMETDPDAVREQAFAVLPDLIADGFFDII